VYSEHIPFVWVFEVILVEETVDPVLDPILLVRDCDSVTKKGPLEPDLFGRHIAFGDKVSSQEMGECLTVELSVLIFASAIALVFTGFASFIFIPQDSLERFVRLEPHVTG